MHTKTTTDTRYDSKSRAPSDRPTNIFGLSAAWEKPVSQWSNQATEPDVKRLWLHLDVLLVGAVKYYSINVFSMGIVEYSVKILGSERGKISDHPDNGGCASHATGNDIPVTPR